MSSFLAIRRELSTPAAHRIFDDVAYGRLDAAFAIEVATKTPPVGDKGRLSVGELPHALVVEHDPDVRELLGAHLRRLGCSVDLAGKGREGLRAATVREPDLAVIDVDLSDIDGRVVFEALRRDNATAHCRVVFISVFDQVDLDSYGDGFLPMPFDRNDVDRVLGPLLAAIKPH